MISDAHARRNFGEAVVISYWGLAYADISTGEFFSPKPVILEYSFSPKNPSGFAAPRGAGTN